MAGSGAALPLGYPNGISVRRLSSHRRVFEGRRSLRSSLPSGASPTGSASRWGTDPKLPSANPVGTATAVAFQSAVDEDLAGMRIRSERTKSRQAWAAAGPAITLISVVLHRPARDCPPRRPPGPGRGPGRPRAGS